MHRQSNLGLTVGEVWKALISVNGPGGSHMIFPPILCPLELYSGPGEVAFPPEVLRVMFLGGGSLCTPGSLSAVLPLLLCSAQTQDLHGNPVFCFSWMLD